jgi:hypothetical protein
MQLGPQLVEQLLERGLGDVFGAFVHSGAPQAISGLASV